MDFWKTAKWIWAEGYDSVNAYLILEGRFTSPAGGPITAAISSRAWSRASFSPLPSLRTTISSDLMKTLLCFIGLGIFLFYPA